MSILAMCNILVINNSQRGALKRKQITPTGFAIFFK